MSYKRKGAQINRLQHLGRDHIKGDYAGDENHGLHKGTRSEHSTNVKGRKIGRAQGKDPVR